VETCSLPLLTHDSGPLLPLLGPMLNSKHLLHCLNFNQLKQLNGLVLRTVQNHSASRPDVIKTFWRHQGRMWLLIEHKKQW
jgi:hypothetical protein